MEGDLLRALASDLPEGEIENMTDKLAWGLALYTDVERVTAPREPAEKRTRRRTTRRTRAAGSTKATRRGRR